MNLQIIYDTVATHLLRQNARSDEGDGVCRYRGPNGLMCAVGVLIPDNLYCEELEAKSVNSATVLQVLCDAGVLDATEVEPIDATQALVDLADDRVENPVANIEPHERKRAMLRFLQWMHDTQHPDQWRQHLLRVAAVFNLEFIK